MQKPIIYPAEWEQQSAVQIAWPDPHTDWANMLDEVERCFAQIALEISKRQGLIVCCETPDTVRPKLAQCRPENIRYVATRHNDTWARDFGGITIYEGGEPRILDFTFNGWGLKFAANHDNQITRHLAEQGIFRSGIPLRNFKKYALEGGSMESDGQGTMLTTEECLLNVNRNSWMDKNEIEQMLKDTFGLSQVLWLKNGYLAGDDTDSHIDTLARFCSPSSIAYVKCEDEKDEHFTALATMEAELKTFKQLNGAPYELIPLPMAEAVYFEGHRLPATYANFLIINGAVLVPTYQTKTDAQALKKLQKAFPDREIVGVDCSPLIKQHGSLHCVTMQYPNGVVN
ncbi:MAG: agmatine deiminase family protein [Cyclobacteriaceae bacterium]|nr:agmatine deiminase family protein [Cyclobacteriaceae bacterium]